jgi:hypothetical protein
VSYVSLTLRSAIVPSADDPRAGIVRVRLDYRAAEPYEITMTLHYGDQVVRWSFARDMLDPYAEPTPARDVTITWTRGEVLIRLFNDQICDPRERAVTLALSAARIRDFLAETYAIVPRGMERVDIDAELRALLG